MNIGIIVFSRTGNTLSVAEKIREACEAQGHTAVIERVMTQNEEPNSKLPIKLTETPDPSRYDAFFFGAPVEAFSLCAIMKAYLEQIPELPGKISCCFTTQHFSKPWMGGNRTVRQMSDLCRAKGMKVAETGVVNWSSKSRESQIREISSRLSKV